MEITYGDSPHIKLIDGGSIFQLHNHQTSFTSTSSPTSPTSTSSTSSTASITSPASTASITFPASPTSCQNLTFIFT